MRLQLKLVKNQEIQRNEMNRSNSNSNFLKKQPSVKNIESSKYEHNSSKNLNHQPSINSLNHSSSNASLNQSSSFAINSNKPQQNRTQNKSKSRRDDSNNQEEKACQQNTGFSDLSTISVLNKSISRILSQKDTNSGSYGINPIIQGMRDEIQPLAIGQRNNFQMEQNKTQEELTYWKQKCFALMDEQKENKLGGRENFQADNKQICQLKEENEKYRFQILELEVQKSNEIFRFKQKLQENEVDLKRNIQEELFQLGSNFAKEKEDIQNQNQKLTKNLEELVKANSELVLQNLEQQKLNEQQLESYRELMKTNSQTQKNNGDLQRDYQELWRQNQQQNQMILNQAVTSQENQNTQELFQRVNQLEKELEFLQEELLSTQDENGRLRQYEQELSIENNSLQEKLNSLVQENKQTTSKLISQQESIKETISRLQLDKQLLGQRDLIAEMREQIERFEHVLSNQSIEIAEKKRRITFLESALKALQARLAPKLSILKKTFKLLILDMHLKHLLNQEKLFNSKLGEENRNLQVKFSQQSTELQNLMRINEKSLEEKRSQYLIRENRACDLWKIVEEKDKQIVSIQKDLTNLLSKREEIQEQVKQDKILIDQLKADNQQLVEELDCSYSQLRNKDQELQVKKEEVKELLSAHSTQLKYEYDQDKVISQKDVNQNFLASKVDQLQQKNTKLLTDFSLVENERNLFMIQVRGLKSEVESLKQDLFTQQYKFKEMDREEEEEISKKAAFGTRSLSPISINNSNINYQAPHTPTATGNLQNPSFCFAPPNSSGNQSYSTNIQFVSHLETRNSSCSNAVDSPAFVQITFENNKLNQEIHVERTKREQSELQLNSLKAQVMIVTSDNELLAKRLKELQNGRDSTFDNGSYLQKQLEKEQFDKKLLSEEILKLKEQSKYQEESIKQLNQDWSNRVKILAQNFAFEKQSLEDRFRLVQGGIKQ